MSEGRYHPDLLEATINTLVERNAKLVAEIELLKQRLEFAEWEWGRSDADRMLLQARNAKLLAALHDAFMAMCSQRDNPDDELFQNAIDDLGLAVNQPLAEKP